MISSIQGALRDAQVELAEEGMLPLAEVEVSLNTINKLEGGGGVGFWVAKLGATAEDTATSKVTMILTPPSAAAGQAVAPADDIRATLARAIFEGAAARSTAVMGDPPLVAKMFNIALEFGLKQDGDGKLSLTFPPFSAEAGGSVSRSELQAITIRFE